MNANVVSALCVLTGYGIPADIMGLLVYGSPTRRIRPGALAAVLEKPAPSHYDPTQSLGERLYNSGDWRRPWRDLGPAVQTQYERTALNFMARASS